MEAEMNKELLEALLVFVANVRLMAINRGMAQTCDSDIEAAAEELEKLIWEEIEPKLELPGAEMVVNGCLRQTDKRIGG
jgi:hypothetical protein